MVELKYITTFPQEIIALDEVGRSPLSGPVVIGAIHLKVVDQKSLISLLRFLRRKGIKDSKLLTAEKRAEILQNLGIKVLDFRERDKVLLRGLEMDYVTWEMDHEMIDRENILNASLRGMREATLSFSEVKKDETTLLIDGPMKLKWDNEAYPWKEIPIIKGDKKSPLIGLAAIIAKEKRDSWMRGMHELYPEYGFASNVGYPTKAHREAIAVWGPCPIHRKTFCKVKEYIRS